VTEQSKKAKALENAKRVSDWTATTPLKDVPRNQFGRAAVRPILRDILKIPASTINTNKAIKEAFDKLQCRLDKSQTKTAEPAPTTAPPQRPIAATSVHREIDRLERALKRLEYLENTGKTIL
jgi:ribosome-associated translation inhibitor RaiA